MAQQRQIVKAQCVPIAAPLRRITACVPDRKKAAWHMPGGLSHFVPLWPLVEIADLVVGQLISGPVPNPGGTAALVDEC
jgi:hypothetical protein